MALKKQEDAFRRRGGRGEVQSNLDKGAGFSIVANRHGKMELGSYWHQVVQLELRE